LSQSLHKDVHAHKILLQYDAVLIKVSCWRLRGSYSLHIQGGSRRAFSLLFLDFPKHGDSTLPQKVNN